MTAEVVIMNRLAVSLAADSAVTVGDNKVYDTANKLFALSKHEPIGVMIYGAADFMAVPWETIIKQYRSRLAKKAFNTVAEYKNHLLRFLRRFPPANVASERELIRNLVRRALLSIIRDVEREVKARLAKQNQVTEAETRALVSATIKKHLDSWQAVKRLPDFSARSERTLRPAVRRDMRAVVGEVLQNLPLSRSDRGRLESIALLALTRRRALLPLSGVVVAGFGRKEHYPAIDTIQVECRYRGRLKYSHRGSSKIEEDNNAFLQSFAQQEMVHSFMEGIDPELKRFSEELLSKTFGTFTNKLADSIGEKKKGKRNKLLKIGDDLRKEYEKEITAYRNQVHVGPVLSAVASLPKDELASMAEALVNLTSLKRRVTPETETVGGPIDVAVITKGDGLVWIKRKHYFDPAMNHHFFQNYFRR